MKVFWIYSILLNSFVFTQEAEPKEFLSLWAPKDITHSKNYEVFFNIPNIKNDTWVGIQIGSKNTSTQLVHHLNEKLGFEIEKIATKNNFVDLSLTLLRNSSSHGEQCISKKMSLNINRQTCYTLIQTDKIVYDLGDKIKFRIIVIKKNLKPHRAEHFEVSIINPNGEIVKEFNEIYKNSDNGVYNDEFTLNETDALGDWKIKVVVDHSTYSKRFIVKKVEKPQSDVFIKIINNNLRELDNLEISFGPTHLTNDFAARDVELVIRSNENSSIIFRKFYPNISNIITKSFKVEDDLKIFTNESLKFQATVQFVDPKSQIILQKSENFNVIRELRYHLRVNHPQTFYPGHQLNIVVQTLNWQLNPVTYNLGDVYVQSEFTMKNNSKITKFTLFGVRSDFLEFDIFTPAEAETLNLTISYEDSKVYNKIINSKEVDSESDELIVTARSEKFSKSSSGTTIIDVSSSELLNEISVLISSTNGLTESFERNCNNQRKCLFEFYLNKKMKPLATVSVYAVQNETRMLSGQTEIKFDSQDDLRLSLSNYAVQPRNSVTFNIEGNLNSTIYLVAIDKRRMDQNDIHQSLDEIVRNSKTEIYHLTDDLSTWKNCDENEIERIVSDRVLFFPHYYETIDVESTDDDDRKQIKIEQNEAELIDKQYKEPWLFNEIEIKNHTGKISSTFKVPNIQTTWMISAFMISEENGLIISQPKELKVEKEFFLEQISSIPKNFNETFRLDILAHNYLNNKRSLTVAIALKNRNDGRYNIVNYDEVNNKCISVIESKNFDIRNTFITYGNSKLISYCISPIKSTINSEQNSSILVIARGKDYKQNVHVDFLKI